MLVVQPFVKTIQKLGARHGVDTVFRDFLVIGFSYFATPQSYEEYKAQQMDFLSSKNRYTEEEWSQLLTLFNEAIPFMQEPRDFLGELVTSLKQLNKRSGEVFTPYHIAELMAHMGDVKDGEVVADMCCGSGAMLLGAYHSGKAKGRTYQYVGQDIAEKSYLMTFIQLSVVGATARVILGNSLINEVRREQYTFACYNPFLLGKKILEWKAQFKKEMGASAI